MTERRGVGPRATLALLGALATGCAEPPAPTLIDELDGRPLATAPFGPQQRVVDLMRHENELRGISGLASSREHKRTLWAISDTETRLFAIRVRDDDVKVRKVDVRDARGDELRRWDWEDLARFEQDDRHYLLIADVGTNREHVDTRRDASGRQVGLLHVLREPDPKDDKVRVTRTITFTLPPEPDRDIEAVAVDDATRQILLVEKRAAVKRLLLLDLDRDHHDVQAHDWSPVTLPDLAPWEHQSTRLDSRYLYQTAWRRNPTGLDVFDRQAMLLTNRHAYLYERAPDGNWRAAFAAVPRQLQIPFTVELPGRDPVTLPAGADPVLSQRESICFSHDGDSVFVASEQRLGRAAWLVRFDRR